MTITCKFLSEAVRCIGKGARCGVGEGGPRDGGPRGRPDFWHHRAGRGASRVFSVPPPAPRCSRDPVTALPALSLFTLKVTFQVRLWFHREPPTWVKKCPWEDLGGFWMPPHGWHVLWANRQSLQGLRLLPSPCSPLYLTRTVQGVVGVCEEGSRRSRTEPSEFPRSVQ